MENATSYFDTWLNAQKSLYDGALENAKKTQQLFLEQNNPFFPKDADTVYNLYAPWWSAVQKSLTSIGSGNQAIKDSLPKFLGGSNAYFKLYELWMPLVKAASERNSNPESYKDFLDPGKLKELLDKIFGFDAEGIKLMLSQSLQFFELISGSGNKYTTPWTDAAMAHLGAIPHFANDHPESFIKLFHSAFSAFDSTVGRLFHVPPVGKDREKFELILRCLDDLSVYAAKNIEYQHTIYATGVVAMEQVVEKLAEKIVSGEEVKQFDEFFDMWIDVSEQAYFKLFQTPEFARIQGEVLDAALNVRSHFFRVMELHLYDFPIALRSEMDDLYKTVYDLKKNVKQLEKKLKETSQ